TRWGSKRRRPLRTVARQPPRIAAETASRLGVLTREARLDRVDLPEPPHMALFGRECGHQERVGQRAREGRADYPRPETQHIQIVVLYGLPSRVGVVTDGR